MKIIYSLLLTVFALSITPALVANHEKESEPDFHFGPVGKEDVSEKKENDAL